MDMKAEGSYNTVFLIAGNLFAWLNTTMVHLFLTPRLRCWTEATEPIRKRTIYKKCPLKRTFGQNDEAY